MPQRLTPGDGQDLLASFKRAWEQRDPEAMLELYRDDAEYRVDPFTPPLVGANAIREHWNRLAAEQIHVEVDAERVWVSERTILASWHAAYTSVATAERMRVRAFSTVELDEAGHILLMRDWRLEQRVGTDRGYEPTDGRGE